MALAGAAAVALAGSALAAGAPPLPSADPFYTYSGSRPLSQIAAGTVLKQRSVQIVIDGLTMPYSAFQVLYRTVGELRQPTVTVATVIRPLLAHGPTRIVSYQTFYDALGDQCDPSYTLRGGNPGYADAQTDATLLNNYLLAGDTVVTSDYEGEDLEWTAGQESGWDTLDGIRAAEQALHLPSTTPVGMVGYSGGSIATEWAAELAPTYAPDLHIVGAAAGGIPVDYAHNLAYINGSPGWSGIIPGTLVALTRAFHVSLNPYLSPYGRRLTAAAAHACINTLYGSHPGLKVSQLFKPQYANILQIPAFARIVDHLIMGRSPGHPQEPLFFAVGNGDGIGDGVMIAGDDAQLAHEYCGEGVPVDFQEYKGDSHTDAAIPFEATALAFLASRFAGTPPPDNCGSIGAGNSLAPLPIPCAFASGSVHGVALGPVRLGLTRAQARRRGRISAHLGQLELLCLQPSDLTLAFPTSALLRRLAPHARRALRGRVVAILASEARYGLRGVRAGTPLRLARRRLALHRALRVGGASWYLAPLKRALGIVYVRAGKVAAVGIAARALGRRPALERLLVRELRPGV